MKKIHPMTVLFLGAAPIVAASADLRAALGMSLAVLLVLLGTTLLLGLLCRLIPNRTRIAAAVLAAAGFAAMAQMLLRALLPTAEAMLGTYLAALAAEALIFAAGEEALEEGLFEAIGKALLYALCFAAFTLLLAVLRELFGSASFAGQEIAALKAYRIPLLSQPVGGMLLFAVLLAVVNALVPGCELPGELTRAAVGLAGEKKEG